jgi:glycerol kinase
MHTDDYVDVCAGLPIVPYFSASKLKWILDTHPELRRRVERGHIMAGTIDTYLIWCLTGGRKHVTDVTNASRTMLMNIHTCTWDEQMCQHFGVPLSMLPQICPSVDAQAFGVCSDATPLPGVRIGGVLGDQQAALFGQTCFDVGDAKNTYGTGTVMCMLACTCPMQLMEQPIVWSGVANIV